MRAQGVLVVFLTCFTIRIGQAQAPNDFDSDGTSDLLTVSNAGTGLRWQSFPTVEGGTKVDVTFGSSGDLPIPGSWQSPLEPAISVITTDDKKRHLLWQTLLPNGQFGEQQLGSPGDYVVAGGDFDGDEIADGAVMRVVKGGRFRWSVQLGILSSSPAKTRTFHFGKLGQRILFVNPDGNQDWVGVFGLSRGGRRAELILRNVQTGRQLRYRRFPRRLAIGNRPRPYAVKRDDGSDVLVFLLPDSKQTRLQSYDLSGQLISKANISGTGGFVIGDYDADRAGEEVIIQLASSTVYYNPLDGSTIQQSGAGGTLVDPVEISATTGPTPTPTATPEPSEPDEDAPSTEEA